MIDYLHITPSQPTFQSRFTWCPLWLPPRHIPWHSPAPTLSQTPLLSLYPASGNAYHSSYFTFLCDIISLIFFFSDSFFKVILKLIYYDNQLLQSWCLNAKKDDRVYVEFLSYFFFLPWINQLTSVSIPNSRWSRSLPANLSSPHRTLWFKLK